MLSRWLGLDRHHLAFVGHEVVVEEGLLGGYAAGRVVDEHGLVEVVNGL